MKNQVSFSVLTKVQDVTISHENVNCSYDGLRSFLNVFIDLVQRLPTGATEMGYLSVSAKLMLLNPAILLSETTSEIGSYFAHRSEINSGAWLNFRLDEAAIHTIEKYREGDIHFGIELTFLITVRHVDIYPHGGLLKEKPHILQFSISRSDWAEKLFPKLGYHSFKLIEIPLSHRTLNEAYSDIIAEFIQAEKYFNKPDYDKCVAHCRSTLDALTRNLKKIKETSDSETAFQWLKKIDQSTFEWIDQVNKANSSLTSKAHHAGQTRSFTRYEAESIYLITLGLLNFVGHLSREN